MRLGAGAPIATPAARPVSPEPPGRADAAMPALSRLGLRLLFALARRAPWVLRVLKPLAVWLAVRFSPGTRHGTRANARRLLGPGASDRELAAFTAKVVGNFYDFVADVGRSGAMTAGQLRGRVEAAQGAEAYVDARRRQGGGAIVLTAHMGSFEVGLAMLASVEPHVHVVFKRDGMDGFEAIRRALRRNLGVREAPIDEGWDTWVRLRDALEADQVVVMQGDRAMPGQRAQAVPMLGGHVRLPIGPVKLAQISGSPIYPVFTVRTPSGRCRLFVEPPIFVDPAAALAGGIHPALLEIGRVIERFVRAHPDQWLVLSPAFVEDAVF